MRIRYGILILLILLAAAGCALAECEFPALNEAGFLDEGEFVYASEEEGVWRYASPTLWVEILRHSDTHPNVIWYEAEIRAAEGELFRMLPWKETKRWSSLQYPYRIAREHQTVFALTGDFAHLRITKKRVPGIIIRDGILYSKRTKGVNKAFPNLDTLAILPDGDMQVFRSNEKTPEEYAEMGALDVLAFGPWMIRDGELNTAALKRYGAGRAQRAGIGIVEKGHYFAIMTEGRNKRSAGTSIRFIAERLQTLGCTAALNLDGGQSAAILFMGNQICLVTNEKGLKASARKAAEILGIGVSPLCAVQDDPF
ncbi:MAG: phosphodiester glycosidase family protein [Clostridia bacterium]|nr:phosphodiester glycosidase family protein [Clostridia bacterium]